MIPRYAHWISRFRWGMVLGWVLLTVASVLWLPSLGKVVAHQSTNFLPTSNSVIVAQNLLNTVHTGGSKTKAKSSAVIGISDETGLTSTESKWFLQKLATLDANHSKYGVSDLHDVANSDKGLAASFHSKDGTAQIALVDFPGQSADKATTRTVQNLHTLFQSPPGNAHVLFTGDALIQQDDATISEQGASKSAVVTVILVLGILLLVFRSVVAPLVTLVGIALSFMVSSSVVAWFATHGLPVSTFTQTFLVAILFGAGTDYTIILLNRYREELTHPSASREEALAASLQAIGKTIVFSGLTVLVSFAVLYFANFGLYRSAVGVAVGVGITLISCLTLIPALMSILGPYLFWPKRPVPGAAHAPSKAWLWSGRVAIRKPWITLAVLAVVLAPIAMLFTNDRSFDPMADIPSAPSVQGFQIVGKAFGQGQVLPMNVVLQTPGNLRTSQGMATIEQISRAIIGNSVVSQVDSATRPEGTVISQFQLATQNQLAANGLSQVLKGVQTLQTGISSQTSTLTAHSSQVQQLGQGASQIAAGTTSLAHGLQVVSGKTGQLATGASATAAGEQKVSSVLQQLASGATKVSSQSKQLTGGLSQTSTGLSKVSSGLGQVDQSSQQLESVASQLANAVAAYEHSHPSAAQDASWQAITKLAQGLKQGTTQTSAATHQMTTASQTLATSLQAIAKGQSALSAANQQVASGLTQVASATNKVNAGMNQIASGSHGLATGLYQLSAGANTLQHGSHQVANGVHSLTQSVTGLPTALSSVTSAIGKMGAGVHTVQHTLSSSQASKLNGEPGFYIPASALTSTTLQKVMNAYISPNGHVASFTVILNINPYSQAAISAIPGIQQAAQSALAMSPLHQGTVMTAGVTPTQSALNTVSNQDFVHSVGIILVVIFLLLAVMLQSLLTPLYIIVSLIGSYFVTMGILQTLTIHVLHKPGLSWTVPFFVFLLLVALGVDYSIFLLSRFQEIVKTNASPAEAMRMAMGHMGNVVFSAAIIMAGTFGSLAVSGVTSLVEIGLGIIIGLLLYTTVMLGLFVPACAAVIGKGYLWPFRSTEESSRIVSPALGQINQ